MSRSKLGTALVRLAAMGMLSATALVAQADDGRHFLARQCSEDALGLSVDAAGWAAVVGPDFALVTEGGKARLGILAQDCSQYAIDGEDFGPTQDLHLLILLQRAPEVEPVVGTEETRPTMRWFQLFAGSSNAAVREAWRAAGRTIHPIEGLTVQPPSARRTGQAAVTENLRLGWTVESAPPAARLVGVNHEIYARDDGGAVVLIRVQGSARVSAGLSAGRLEVTGSDDSYAFLAPGTYPAMVFSPWPMWARATIEPASPPPTSLATPGASR